MSNKKVVLITGVSSGIGNATAQHLVGNGYRVFGTSRSGDAISGLAQVEVLALDVRSRQSVRDAVNTVVQKTGRLDVLVNNAGYALGGAAEDATSDDAKAQFETNYFGLVRMTQAVLPAMRSQRAGWIINISSLVGRVGLPFLAHYSASKFAVEGYSEALRYEVRPFGIHVSVVEPGFTKTNLGAHERFPARPVDEYGPWRKRMSDAVSDATTHAPGPEIVAQTVAQIAKSASPKLRYAVGRESKLVQVLRWFAPSRVFESAIWRTFGLQNVHEESLNPRNDTNSTDAASAIRTAV